jgi:hypothetical protein
VRQTNVGKLQDFLNALSDKVPADFSVHASPIFGQEWLVIIESATQKDQYHIDLAQETWVRYVEA